MTGTNTPRLVHSLPGRVRLHLAAWRTTEPRWIEATLGREPGVERVRANALTGNVLVEFDPAMTDAERIRGAAGALPDAPPPTPPAAPQPAVPAPDGTGRRRIRVRGLENNPELAERLEARLRRFSGLRARANPVTGRLLLEGLTSHVQLEAVLTEVRSLELPLSTAKLGHLADFTAAETTPSPTSGPLLQSGLRLAGAAVGLLAIAADAFTGKPRGGPAIALRASGAITILQSIPIVQATLRGVLGRNLADVALTLPKIAMLTLGGNPLGLAVAGLNALHLYTALRTQEEAWEDYGEEIEEAEEDARGSDLRIEAGERMAFAATVVEGSGTALGPDGLPVPAVPGAELPGGTMLHGGPFLVSPHPPEPFAPALRPVPPPPSFYERYLEVITPLSLLYVGATALLTRSLERTLASLLLVNARPAVLGADAAATDAAARVVHSGATVVGSHPARLVRLPHVLLLDSPRLLVRGLEIASTTPVEAGREPADILERAAGISAAAGSPWGAGVFRAADAAPATAGRFDGTRATASIDGVAYSLGPPTDWNELPGSIRMHGRGQHVLLLRNEVEERLLGALILRPRLARGVERLLDICRAHGVDVAVRAHGVDVAVRAHGVDVAVRAHGVDVAVRAQGDRRAAQLVAQRAGLPLVEGSAVEIIHERQRGGARVMFVSGSAAANSAFLAADLAVGLTDAAAPFSEVPDLLVPRLDVLTAVLETAALNETVRRDSIALSIGANVVGGVWGWWADQEMIGASSIVDSASFAALSWAWLRLRSDQPTAPAWAEIADPRPEQWGARSIEAVLQAFASTADGLASEEAARRHRVEEETHVGHPLFDAFVDNLRSPLTAAVAAGTALTLLHGSRADAAILALTLAANVGVGTWQEYRTNEIAVALRRRGVARAQVLRDGEPLSVPADELVPGDVLLIGHGDRIAADARVIEADDLEVDEAALTGESFPVPKLAEGGTASNRILLEGSDVLVGHGRAVVVAVGSGTRMGATTAAVLAETDRGNPLSARLGQLFWQVLPLTVMSGAVVTLAGLVRGRPAAGEVISGASIALAALPEALPILAGMGQAAAARRLSRRNALVRRPSAIEALGRVDVACVDKTGTLTYGRLSVRLTATCDGREAALPHETTADALRILLAAGLASPHPDAETAGRHATDRAVVGAAEEVGLGEEIRARRVEESRFDTARPYHAAVAGGRLHLKGSPEWVAARCTAERVQDEIRPLDEDGRERLLARARGLAARGLRVLMVAEGEPGGSLEHPRELIALGMLAIADPLRETVPDAVRRCRDAGIRVIMLTGDHPATAEVIAREAGLLGGAYEILTGADIAQLEDGELDDRLERAAVVARATPLDKLRIVESLRRRGHAIAMTGDGVNDAPALRLADVGVAMGRSGTEVARHAADIVLTDDDFATLVEALVEGRSFWRNLRRALALLLGGNFGELLYMAAGSVFGLGASLTVRQILATNLITDALPAFAVVVQEPEHRVLAGLDREGEASLGGPLWNEVIRRTVATAGPALAAYLLARPGSSVVQARSVGFASIVATQLALTIDAGRVQGNLTRPVLGAVAVSGAATLALLAVPPLRALFGLATPTPLGWALIGGSTLLAPLISRVPLLPPLDGADQPAAP